MLHLPQNHKEWFFFSFFWIGGLWTVVYECCIVVWQYHQEWNRAVAFHIVLTVFLTIVIFSNMCLLITTDVSVKSLVNEKLATNMADWKYCEHCKHYVPPRSHHCKICDMCILKRDHHCWFVGYCVGFHNHRYLVSLALFTCIAGVYCNIYNWDFVVGQKGGFAWTTIPSFIAPQVGLVFGYYSILDFALTANTSLGLFFTIFFIWLLYCQLAQLVNGQVMYERRKGIHNYNHGLRSNINEVFGSSGLFALLCPFLPTKLAGDGTYFQQNDYKSE